MACRFGGMLSVAWTGSQYVGVGWGVGVLTSPHAATWSNRNSAVPLEDLHSVIGTGKVFAAAYWNGIITSPDAIAWSNPSVISSTILNFAGRVGDRFSTAGYSGVTLISDDGVNWTYGAAAALPLEGVACVGKTLVAVGQGIYTSPLDTVHWKAQAYPNTIGSSFQAVSWTGQGWIAVGTDGICARATDGVSWRSLNTVRILHCGAEASGRHRGKRMLHLVLDGLPVRTDLHQVTLGGIGSSFDRIRMDFQERDFICGNSFKNKKPPVLKPEALWGCWLPRNDLMTFTRDCGHLCRRFEREGRK